MPDNGWYAEVLNIQDKLRENKITLEEAYKQLLEFSINMSTLLDLR